MKIRRMANRDLSMVRSLAEQLGYLVSEEEITSRFESMQHQKDYALFIAESESGSIMGYVQINLECTTLLVGPRAEIAALVVDESSRGKGIGAALLLQAESWAKENAYEIVRVRSGLKRVDAHRFYKREGYDLLKSSHLFVKKFVSERATF